MSIIQKIADLIARNRSTTIAAGAATALGAAAVDATLTPANATNLNSTRQSCDNAAQSLANTPVVDVTNSYAVQQSLVSYWSGVGEKTKASEAQNIQGGKWDAKSRTYHHADFLGLQAALTDAKADIAARNGSCKTPTPQTELPNFAEHLATIAPPTVGPHMDYGVHVGALHKSVEGQHNVTAPMAKGFVQLNVPVTESTTLFVQGGVGATLPEADIHFKPGMDVGQWQATTDLRFLEGQAGVKHTLTPGLDLSAAATVMAVDQTVNWSHPSGVEAERKMGGNFAGITAGVDGAVSNNVSIQLRGQYLTNEPFQRAGEADAHIVTGTATLAVDISDITGGGKGR